MATKLSPVLVADYNTSLTTKISVGGTTATLLSNVDDDGNTMPDGLVYLTLDGDNSSKEHISATKVGADLTVIKSVSRQGVESAGVVREHRVGSTVVLTNFAHIKFINDLLDGTTDLDGSNPLKYDADPTLTDDKEIATKKYADDLAIAGSPNMTTTVKGIAEEATEAEIDADTGAGATAARLAINPATLVTSKYGVRLPTADEKAALAGSGTPAAGNKFVTADTDALKELLANKDTDVTLFANSDTKYPSQKAVKTFAERTFKNGTTTYNLTTASGTQNIAHGLGKIPKKIKINGRAFAGGYGTFTYDSVYNGTTQSSLSVFFANGTFRVSIGTTLRVNGVSDNETQYQTATITFNATNIILTWVKTGAPSGTLQILWEAEA